MTLTVTDIQSIKEAFKPEFDSLKSELKEGLAKLDKKLGRGFQKNEKDHNLILKYLDERDSRLEKQVKALNDKSMFSSLIKPLV